MKIKHIKAREILDSRGRPTVEVDLLLEKTDGNCAWGRASAPSGASVGSREAIELRDQDLSRYCGYGVNSVIANIENIILPSLIAHTYQPDILSAQLELDKNLMLLYHNRNVGSNAILPISLAFAKAFARLYKIPLFALISKLLKQLTEFKPELSKLEPKLAQSEKRKIIAQLPYNLTFPMPMINLINGGAHANNNLAIQEFMVVPLGANSINEALRMVSEIFMTLQKNLKKLGYSIMVGDEGGLACNFINARSALDSLMEAIYQCGYINSVKIALDVAASEFFQNGQYFLKGEDLELDATRFISYLESLIADYPIISIEDALAENDWKGWHKATQDLGQKVMLVGDDLFTTNSTTLQYGIDSNIANAILIKPNQVGTLTDTMKTIALAFASGYQPIVSHRSGETEDTTIAHLAYGVASPFIKAGSVCRTERLCKYNEMLRISEYIERGGGEDLIELYV